jgi:hypothetical protein
MKCSRYSDEQISYARRQVEMCLDFHCIPSPVCDSMNRDCENGNLITLQESQRD